LSPTVFPEARGGVKPIRDDGGDRPPLCDPRYGERWR
jgi:hypothetical protein